MQSHQAAKSQTKDSLEATKHIRNKGEMFERLELGSLRRLTLHLAGNRYQGV